MWSASNHPDRVGRNVPNWSHLMSPLAILVVVLGSLTSEVSMAQGTDPATQGGQQRALAALVALRGAVGTAALLRGYRYVVLPSRAAVSEQDAAAQLAALPKPVSCAGQEHEGALLVHCEPLNPSMRQMHHDAAKA